MLLDSALIIYLLARLAQHVRSNTTGWQTKFQGPEGTEYLAGSETSANSLF